jgi:hypothetical protein
MIVKKCLRMKNEKKNEIERKKKREGKWKKED